MEKELLMFECVKSGFRCFPLDISRWAMSQIRVVYFRFIVIKSKKLRIFNLIQRRKQQAH